MKEMLWIDMRDKGVRAIVKDMIYRLSVMAIGNFQRQEVAYEENT